MDFHALNKIIGAALGALLVFLLLGFASELVFKAGGHGDDHVLAFALDTGEDDTATAEAEESAPVSLATLVAEADTDAGAKIWNQCRACHKIEAGANGVGPHLWNIVGREIASVDGFSYSDALSAKDGVWDLETLSAWLKNPSDWAPGTTMGYAGLADPADRVNLIAYMNAEGDDPADLAAMAPEAPVEAVPEKTETGDDAAEGADAGGADDGQDLAALLDGASAERGEAAFAQCQACHRIAEGENLVGPHLWNVVGREIAAVEAFGYSEALAGMDGVWTVERLMAWLEDPNSFAPDNMMMMGYPDAQERMDIIVYMNEAGDEPVDLTAALAQDGTTTTASGGEAGPADDGEATEGATDTQAPETGDGDGADRRGDASGSDAQEGETRQATAGQAEDDAPAAGGGQYADLLASADAEAGRKVFNRCRACHKVEEGANGVGPHLHGVVGRDIAGVEGYRYSDALSGVDGVWTLDSLMEWLKAPNSFAPGNKMAMAFPDPQDRINVITYLNEADGSPEPLQ